MDFLMSTTTVGVKLDDEIRERLKALSHFKDRSPHWVMKTAIREYLDKEEAYEKEKQEDLQRWENYQRTGAFIDNDDMMQWLDGLAERARRKSASR